VVQSEARRESDLNKLSQKIKKLEKTASNHLKEISKEEFACAIDARKALSKITKKLKYHEIKHIEIIEIISENKEKQLEKVYQISATLSTNEAAINVEKNSAGRFVLATNVVDDDADSLTNDEMISEYKATLSCERGFGFLKDPLFFADSVFLKSPERIESLTMIMGLCLLVYTLAQPQLGLALSSSKSAIKNQLGKLTNRPTLRWIFQCFQHIHLVTSNYQKEITNLTPERNFILHFFPQECHRYYSCAT
jgi:transposase